MPLLGFKKQFAEMIESGAKCQTIRAYRKDGRNPKPGDTLYLYTGLRTKQCRKLKDVICENVSHLDITDTREIYVDYVFQNRMEEAVMSFKDGFESPQDFFEETHGLPFRGLLIEW